MREDAVNLRMLLAFWAVHAVRQAVGPIQERSAHGLKSRVQDRDRKLLRVLLQP